MGNLFGGLNMSISMEREYRVHVSWPVSLDVYFWTCIPCMHSMYLVPAVVHMVGRCLIVSFLFITHLQNLTSCGRMYVSLHVAEHYNVKFGPVIIFR